MEILELALTNDTQLRVNSQTHPIQLGDSEAMAGGRYAFRALTFQDPEMQLIWDGGLFILPPNTASNPVLITGNIRCHDVAVSGTGKALIYTEDDGISIHTFINNPPKTSVLTYGHGAFVTYVSEAQEELRILGFYNPPYGDGAGMEITAEVEQQNVGDLVVPDLYWRLYHKLLGR